MTVYINEAKAFHQRQHIKNLTLHHLIEHDLSDHADLITQLNRSYSGYLINAWEKDKWLRYPNISKCISYNALDTSVEIIIDSLTLHQFNDPRNTLFQAKHLLLPGGVFIAALLGGDTLTELRQTLIYTDLLHYQGAYQRFIPMIHPQSACQLLSNIGFKNPIVDLKRFQFHYSDLLSLLFDLKDIGERGYLNQLNKNPAMTKQYLYEAETYYFNNFASDDKKLKVTFDILYLTGWSNKQIA